MLVAEGNLRVHAHPISVSRTGQLPNSGAADRSSVDGASLGPLGVGENRSLFLIHTNKSGGRSANADDKKTYDQDKTARDFRDGAAENEGISALPERLEKYARQTEDALKFGSWLTGAKGSKRIKAIGHRVASCGSHLVFHDYYRRDLVKLAMANNCCMAMLCPFCAGRRAIRHLQNTIPKLRHVLASEQGLVPYLLTITIRDEDGCADMYRKIKALWSKVIEIRRESLKGKRAGVCWGKLAGGVMSFEVKRGSGSGLWHIHGHALVCGAAGLSPREFQEGWSDLVGYWAQLDLRPLNSSLRLQLDPDSQETEQAVAKDLMEVFKYALKFNAMTFEDRREAFEKLQGKRMVSAFGAFYGVKLEDDYLDDLEGLDMEPYIRLVYAAIAGPVERSYQLRKSERVCPGEDGDETILIGTDANELPSVDGDFV